MQREHVTLTVILSGREMCGNQRCFRPTGIHIRNNFPIIFRLILRTKGKKLILFNWCFNAEEMVQSL
uniref:Uncharacterized protein n=1 Tax=Schistosoma japonicum TaxID=6182 RepID=Q5BZ73_SCHJA|nr:unknown [Schistosoma japonicum]